MKCEINIKVAGAGGDLYENEYLCVVYTGYFERCFRVSFSGVLSGAFQYGYRGVYSGVNIYGLGVSERNGGVERQAGAIAKHITVTFWRIVRLSI